LVLPFGARAWLRQRPCGNRSGCRATLKRCRKFLRLLGNPHRLLIVLLLCEGEYAVSEIEERLGIRQPTLSQQIGALREASVIEGRRKAKAVIYRLVDQRTRQLLDALHHVFGPGGHAVQIPQTSPLRIASSMGAASFARVASQDPDDGYS
jgi:DNA-binding transcriptional ArsR family regulator